MVRIHAPHDSIPHHQRPPRRRVGLITVKIIGAADHQPCRITEALLRKQPGVKVERIPPDAFAVARAEERGFAQFPIVEVYDRAQLVDTWCGFRKQKIIEWRNKACNLKDAVI